MNLLNKLRQLWQPARVPAAPVPLVGVGQADAAGELEALGGMLEQKLLAAIARSFPALQPTPIQEGIVLPAAGITLQASAFSLTRHSTVLVGGFSVLLRHARDFPAGLADNFAGIGADETATAEYGARVYTESVLPTVIEALEGRYDPGLDFSIVHDGTHWHTITSPLQVQGAWTPRGHELATDYYARQFQPLLLEHLPGQMFHWVKVYASRQDDGEFIGECTLDNEPWAAGLQVLKCDVAAWPEEGGFAAQRQFILFRQCGLTHAGEPDAG